MEVSHHSSLVRMMKWKQNETAIIVHLTCKNANVELISVIFSNIIIFIFCHLHKSGRLNSIYEVTAKPLTSPC